MKIYCVKCKEKTETLQAVRAISKNNKKMIKGLCSQCGKQKQQFVNSLVFEEIDQ